MVPHPITPEPLFSPRLANDGPRSLVSQFSQFSQQGPRRAVHLRPAAAQPFFAVGAGDALQCSTGHETHSLRVAVQSQASDLQ